MEHRLSANPASHAHQIVSGMLSLAWSTLSETLLALGNGYSSVSSAAAPHIVPESSTAAWVADHSATSGSRLSVVIPALVGARRGQRLAAETHPTVLTGH